MEMEDLLELKNLRKRQIWIILAGIVIVGFSLRYFPYLHRLWLDDTYLQYGLAKSITAGGGVPERLMLSRYPLGKDISATPLLLPYLIGYSYRILQLTGVSLAGYMVVLPPIFGSLGAVALFLLAEELLDRRTALYTALIYAVLPAAISRTQAGFVEKEGLAAIFIFLWLYFFVRASEEFDIEDHGTIYLPLLAGFFMAMAAFTWGGTAYFALLIALTVTVRTLLGAHKRLALSTAVMTFSGFVVMHFFQPEAFSLTDLFFDYRYAGLAYASIFAFTMLLPEVVGNASFKRAKPSQVAVLSIGLITIFILLLGQQERLLIMVREIFNALSGAKKPNLVLEAASLSSVGFRSLFWRFSLLLFFIPLGLYYYIRGIRERPTTAQTLLILWAATATYAAYLQVRLFFNLAPVAAMLIAYSFYGLTDPLKTPRAATNKKRAKKRKKKHSLKRSEMLKPSMKLDILLLLIFSSILSTAVVAVNTAGDTKSAFDEPFMKWEGAANYLREGTPKDSVVFSWWDYGYMIQGLGERATIVDPGVGGIRRVDSALLYTSSEPEVMDIISRYNPNKKPAYLAVSRRELFDSQAPISATAKEDLDIRIIFDVPVDEDSEADFSRLKQLLSDVRSTIFFRDQTSILTYDLVYLPNLEHPEIADNLFPRLMPFEALSEDGNSIEPFGLGERLDHFQLEWDNGYVYIFRVV